MTRRLVYPLAAMAAALASVACLDGEELGDIEADVTRMRQRYAAERTAVDGAPPQTPEQADAAKVRAEEKRKRKAAKRLAERARLKR